MVLALAGRHEVVCRRLAEPGDRDEGRDEGLALDLEFDRVGFVDIHFCKAEAAHVKLIHRFKCRERVAVLGRGLGVLVDLANFAPHRFDAAGHQRRVEGILLAAAVEVAAVVRERIVDLEIGNAEGHRDVGDRVGLREEVLNFAAGLDVPLRDAVPLHLLDDALRPGLALADEVFADGLHEFEGAFRLDAPVHEVEHDVVAAADAVVDVRDLIDDEVVDVAVPDVRAVGETRKAHEGREFVRLGVDKHLAGEVRAELRDADGAGLANDGVVVGQAQHLRGLENAHGVVVVKGDLPRVDAGGVLEHADHGRVIVAQLVELEEVCLHAVVLEMGRDDVAVRVVRRVLDGAEISDVHVLRDDNEAAGVLARRALDADAALREAVFLRLRDLDLALVEVIFYVAVGRFFGQRADGAGLEDVVPAKELARVLVRAALILAGEVEVDIGDLVAAEAQKGLERDVKALFFHLCAAVRAILVVHVRAAAILRALLELAVLAFRAEIVRRQGVDLRDAGHVRDERRADTASRTDEVAVVVRVLDELLGRHVDDVVAAAQNAGLFLGVDVAVFVGRVVAVELLLDALGDARVGVLAVELVQLVVDEVFEVLGGIFDLRRVEVLRQQDNVFALVRDGVRVRHDDLAALVLAQIGELVEHFVGRLEIQRHRTVGVLKAAAREQDAAVDLLFGVEEVDVAGRDDGLAEFFAQRDDAAVEVPEVLVVFRGAVFEHKGVVADRLNLQIVVEAAQALQFLVALFSGDGIENFARLARRADDDALAVLQQQAFRHDGVFLEVLQMGL